MTKEADDLRKELVGRRRILDVGCGIGAFAQRLPELNIIGVDTDEEMIKAARARTTNTYCLADAKQLPFLNASFDALFFVTCLEFLDEYKAAIDEAARVLESEGKLVVMALNPESEYFKARYSKEGSYFRRMKGNVLNFMTHLKHQQFLPGPNVICDALSHAWCSFYLLLTLLRSYRQR